MGAQQACTVSAGKMLLGGGSGRATRTVGETLCTLHLSNRVHSKARLERHSIEHSYPQRQCLG